jgi:hypothetical protein
MKWLEGNTLMFFKKKKIYKVEYRDRWNDYGSTLVKATDEVDAWNKAMKQFWSGSAYRPTVCLRISELTNA